MVQVEVIAMLTERFVEIAVFQSPAHAGQRSSNDKKLKTPFHPLRRYMLYCFIDDTPLLNLGHSMY